MKNILCFCRMKKINFKILPMFLVKFRQTSDCACNASANVNRSETSIEEVLLDPTSVATCMKRQYP